MAPPLDLWAHGPGKGRTTCGRRGAPCHVARLGEALRAAVGWVACSRTVVAEAAVGRVYPQRENGEINAKTQRRKDAKTQRRKMILGRSLSFFLRLCAFASLR